MKSITFEEHYVIEDIQKETMNAISADPRGVPMKVMLEGLEKKTGFTNADELSHHNEMVKWSFSNVHERPKTLLYQGFCHF